VSADGDQLRPRENYDEAVSCTRAGLLIIIICGLGLSLLGPLEVRKTLKDLERYIALRVTLAAQLGEIDHHPCVSNKDIALVALSRSDCFKDYIEESNPATQAISTLILLNNSTHLEKARRGYYFDNFSIYRWKLRVNTVFLSGNTYENVTFRTVKELSDFESDMSPYETLVKKSALLDTQWTPVSIKLATAVIFIELGLFLALAYFWLMFVEATYSGTSKRKGTIFKAAHRTWLSRSLSFCFVIFPAIVVLLLLIHSYPSDKPFNMNSIGLSELLFIAVLFMSIKIWRTAQIDWSKSNAN
jgi:hypothetical protein